MWSALSPDRMAAAVARDPVVVLPLAATEQHGPHLPSSTDADIGIGLLAEAFGRLPDRTPAWVGAPVTVGASLEHSAFAGTRSIPADELVQAIVDFGAGLAAAGVRRLLLSNSHGGNRYAMDSAALILRVEHDMLVIKANWPRFPRPDDVEVPDGEWRHGIHGGAIETAMMLHLRPDLVRLDAIEDFTSLGEELERTLRRVGPEGEAPFAWMAGDLNPEGVVGRASLATAEMGERLVRHYGEALADVVLDALEFPIGRLAPSPRARLDESTAWAFVRAARSLGADVMADRWPRRVTLDSAPEVWLDVEAGGSWEASSEVTPAAGELLDLFLPVAIEPDFVIGQLGQSLDGRIATESGASHYVTGAEDIERLHRLRALVDAVIVGASTVEHDDPRLTVRLVEGADPVRVVLDPSRRLNAASRVFTGPAHATLAVRGRDGASETGAVEEAGDGYEELSVPWSGPGELDLSVLIERLRARGLRRLLVEGGGRTVSGFLERGLLDRLHVTVAPILIGSGRPSVALPPIDGLEQALRPVARRFTMGEDVLFDLDLRSTSA
jgi:creatinine amidohydrolase